MPPTLAHWCLPRLTFNRFPHCFASLPLREGFFIVNITQLRDTINTLLTDSPSLIGTYTLPNASTVPAIYTVGRQSVPSDWKVTGLEVTMREFPEPLPSAMVGAVKILQLWEVMLVQYTSSSSTLATAMERMTRRFPDGTFRYLPGDDVAYERCKIIIPDTILRNLYPSI
jgi:hypothetical protein